MFGPTAVLTGAGTSNAGRPKLPIRLMAGLLYLKHGFNLSDKELVVRWSENVLWQFFSGMGYYEHLPPRGATQIGRFRRDLDEDGTELRRRAGGYAHAKQFRRLKRVVKTPEDDPGHRHPRGAAQDRGSGLRTRFAQGGERPDDVA